MPTATFRRYEYRVADTPWGPEPLRRHDTLGWVRPLDLDRLNAAATGSVPVEDLLTVEEALTRLEAIDARSAQVVTLRFFAGMSNPEIAEHLNVSVRTVEGDWAHARAWLKRELAGQNKEEIP